MRAPIEPHAFRRLLFQWPRQLGFVVRFPGRTPDPARAWLKAHGYAYKSKQWERPDRKLTRLRDTGERDAHLRRVLARRKRSRTS